MRYRHFQILAKSILFAISLMVRGLAAVLVLFLRVDLVRSVSILLRYGSEISQDN